MQSIPGCVPWGTNQTNQRSEVKLSFPGVGQ